MFDVRRLFCFLALLFLGMDLCHAGIIPMNGKNAKPADKKAVRAKLAKTIERIDISGVRLDETLRMISRRSGLKIFTDWKVLKDAANNAVHVHLSNVSWKQVISYVLQSASGLPQIEYILEKDGIRLFPDYPEITVVEKQYDVSDITKMLGKSNGREQFVDLICEVVQLWPVQVSPDIPAYRWKGDEMTVTGELLFHKELQTLLNWLRYPILPEGKGKEKQQLVAREKRLLKQLDAKCKTSVNKSMSLRQAVDFLRKESEVNIFVDWVSLSSCGVEPTHTIKLNTAGLKLSQVLDKILEIGKKNGKPLLGFRLEGNVLVIDNIIGSNNGFFLRAYDIGDLVINKGTRKVSLRPDRPDPVRVRKIVAKIRKLVIAPAKQDEFGSQPVVDVCGDRLLVLHNWRSHQKVVEFLDNLRLSLSKTPVKAKSE